MKAFMKTVLKVRGRLFLLILLAFLLPLISAPHECAAMIPDGKYQPSIAYDPMNNRYLVVYEKLASGVFNIYGQLF